MYVKLTEKDRNYLKQLEADYDQQIQEAEDLIDKLRPGDEGPQGPSGAKFGTPEYDEFYHNWEKWLSSGSQEWREARKTYFNLFDEKSEAISAYYKQIERREFSKLGGDRDKIIQSAKEQINLMIDKRYEYYQDRIKTHRNEDGELLISFSARDLRVDGDDIYLDIETLIKECKKGLLLLHYEALSHDPKAIKIIDDLVLSIISDSPKTSNDKGILGATIELSNDVPDLTIRTSRPDTMIVPTSKLVNEAFLGDLYPGTGKKVNVQKTQLAKKQPVYTLISMDIEDLKNQGVKIQGRRELRPYDQEVHDAITSQYIEGGNEYITDSMIFDTISGKEGATLNPRQREAISNSITKLMYSHVRIDASAEAERLGYDKFVYDGYLLPAERVTIALNGTVTECIHLFRTPPLYEYAEKRKQIGRMDVRLLDSPVNKNEETIALQGYLYRRILSMKGSSKLSPTIKYDTVYKQLEISASSDGALRKKKLKVRETVKKILDYWKEKKFIQGYCENSHKSEKGKIDSVTIRF